MSANNNIEAGFTREYNANIQLASQATKHKLADTYMLQTGLTGEQAVAVDLVGVMTGGKRKARLEDFEDNSPTQTTPWYVPDAYSTGGVIDKVDQLKSRVGLAGSYTQAAVAWGNQQMDEQVFDAFFATMIIGKTGTGTEAFDTTNYRIANTVGAAAATGANVEKLLAARRVIKSGDVDLDDPMNKLFCAINAQQEQELINDIRIASKDYQGKSVFEGDKLVSFFGITFVHTEKVRKIGTDFALPFWAKSGMAVGEWQGLEGDIRQLTNKKMKPWVNEVSFMRGATRTEQKKVVQILSKA